MSETEKRVMAAHQYPVRDFWSGQIEGWHVMHMHPQGVPCAEEPSLHDPVLATGEDPRQHCSTCQGVGPFLLDLEEHDGYRFWCAACIEAREAAL